MVHGELWTLRDLFVLPNEYVYWTIQIVMYPFLTGLVAGAFVLSSLYHVFGVGKLKDISRFALVLSFALLPGSARAPAAPPAAPAAGRERHDDAALHVGHRGVRHRVLDLLRDRRLGGVVRLPPALRGRVSPAQGEAAQDGARTARFVRLRRPDPGSLRPRRAALRTDERATRILAAVGIPVALFLHGYAGFIFGSVKANALWMTPLMPVIFIVSAVVSGIAFCLLTYIVTMGSGTAPGAQEARRRETRGAVDAAHGVEVDVVRITAQVPGRLPRPRRQPGAARRRVPHATRRSSHGTS